jgi:hypothetical protein
MGPTGSTFAVHRRDGTRFAVMRVPDLGAAPARAGRGWSGQGRAPWPATGILRWRYRFDSRRQRDTCDGRTLSQEEDARSVEERLAVIDDNAAHRHPLSVTPTCLTRIAASGSSVVGHFESDPALFCMARAWRRYQHPADWRLHKRKADPPISATVRSGKPTRTVRRDTGGFGMARAARRTPAHASVARRDGHSPPWSARMQSWPTASSERKSSRATAHIAVKPRRMPIWNRHPRRDRTTPRISPTAARMYIVEA